MMYDVLIAVQVAPRTLAFSSPPTNEAGQSYAQDSPLPKKRNRSPSSSAAGQRSAAGDDEEPTNKPARATNSKEGMTASDADSDDEAVSMMEVEAEDDVSASITEEHPAPEGNTHTY